MRIYLAKRILFIIPALLIVILLSFLLLHFAPGDPIDRILSSQGIYEDNTPTSITEKHKSELRHQLGLNLPLFYFSISDLMTLEISEEKKASEWKKFIPAVAFHSQNQFHRWVFGDDYYGGLLRGDLGNSWVTGQKVSEIISSRIKWSLFFTIISILLAYLISIPVGLKSASRPGSNFDRSTSALFTILFSLPAFWMATLLMLTFCNPDVFNILPSSGIRPIGGNNEDQSYFQVILSSLPYLILPTICYTYSSFAFLSKSLKESMTEIMQEDYIKTARAKGLDEKTILRKHALRNALLPMIAIFSQVFPFAIGGSVILETIFTIPGMGLAIFQSVISSDFPVIVSVFMITGIITITGFLISDLLYAIADPRITFMNEANK